MRRPGRMVGTALKSMVSKPATVLYPFVASPMPAKFRGKLKVDASKCIGCKMCMRDCPTGAITIRKIGERVFEAEIDLSKCIYCGLCVDVCPRKAVEATEEFELAQLKRVTLRVTYTPPPKPAEPEKKPEERAEPESGPQKKA